MLHKTLFFLALFAAALPALPKEFLDPAALRSNAVKVTRRDFPDSDTVILDDVIEVAYRPDSTSETWDDTAIKILTERGRREARVLTLHFDTAYGSNTFTRVQILKPDGRTIEVDVAAQSKVMVDPDQMKANIYDPRSKVLRLTVPGLEIGDVLRFVSREVLFRTPVPGTWSDYQVFEGTAPIRHTLYRVIAPAELPLRRIALKDPVGHTVTASVATNGDRIVYSWDVHDVPRMFDEPDMPPRYTVVQRLLVSTIPDWRDLSRWYWRLCKPHLEAVTPEMRRKVEELTAGCTNRMEKIRAVFRFVSQEIRYMGITTEEEAPGYEPHDVRITFENRYGVCRDKAALLAAMLRLAGIEAFPVLIMVGPKKDPEVPQPFFNHAVTAALDEHGRYILMDSTDENTRDLFPAYLQDMSYLVARPEGETLRTTPVIPATDNLLRIRTDAALDKHGRLTGRTLLRFEGINDTAYRGYLARRTPEERRRFFEAHLQKNLPGAELLDLRIEPDPIRDTSRPLVVRLLWYADDQLVGKRSPRLLDLPRLGRTLGYVNLLIGKTGLHYRQYPLYTGNTAGLVERIALRLPDGFRPRLPRLRPVENRRLTWKQTLALSNRTLLATNTFLIKTVEFSPPQYLQLRDNLKIIDNNLRKKILLSTAPDAGADLHVLWSTNTIRLASSSSWTATTARKIRILTYAGKKQQSELKIPYNPAWENVDLLYARVTLPDGSQKSVRPEEIHRMDASWTASAPRYPAGKILVVNLPGVEVGSTIEYAYTRTVSGKPFFSSTQIFSAFNPVDRKTVIVSAPTGLVLKTETRDLPAPTVTTNGGEIVRTWTLADIPAVPKEEHLPPWWTFAPTLFLSTGDWSNYAGRVERVLLQNTQNQPQAEKLAADLTAGLTDPARKIRALRDWVAAHIRTAGPALHEIPLSALSPADRTLREGYGCEADRQILLYTLLRAAGLQPRFLLASPLDPVEAIYRPFLRLPSAPVFSSVLLRLDLDGRPLYLDGESQYAELGTSAYDGHPALDLADRRFLTLSIPEDKRDARRARFDLTVSPDGALDLSETLHALGTAFETFHRTYAELTPELRRRHYLELISAFSRSAEERSPLETDYSTYPGTMRFSIHIPDFGVRDGDDLYFKLPGDFGDLLKYRADRRTLPLLWDRPERRRIETVLRLPPGWEPVILPEPFTWRAPGNAGTVSVSVDYDPKTRTVRVVRRADLKPAILPAATYPEIRRARRRIASPAASIILLRCKKQTER